MKIVKKSQADAVAICKSLTHGATPEAIDLIKELAADLTDSTNQLVQGILLLYQVISSEVHQKSNFLVSIVTHFS